MATAKARKLRKSGAAKDLPAAPPLPPPPAGTLTPSAHPYGIKPWGEAYLSGVPEIRTPGLGELAVLPDELLLSLRYALPAAAMGRLAWCTPDALVWSTTQASVASSNTIGTTPAKARCAVCRVR